MLFLSLVLFEGQQGRTIEKVRLPGSVPLLNSVGLTNNGCELGCFDGCTEGHTDG
jgi:hypothetical protein